MRDGSPKRPRRRRGSQADDPYAHFYATYYGLDDAERTPTRHRAAATRTGAVLMAGLAALVRRKAMVVLTLGIAAIGVLGIGVMASATRTGSDPGHTPSLVDTTGSPTGQGGIVAAGTSASPHPSAGSSARSAAASTTVGGLPPDYAPPPVGVPTTTQAAQPSTSSAQTSSHSTPPSSTHHTPPPSTTHTTSSAPPPPTSATPTPTPTPSPSRSCLVPDPLHPGHCIVQGT